MRSGAVRARLGGVTVGDGCPVALIGALNVSPESFYPGSVVADLDALLRVADAMVAAGAAILDVGGMSTAPYRAALVSEAQEAERLAWAVSRLVGKFGVPVSADVSRAGPALAALEAGSAIINDVTGFRGDPGLLPVVAAHGAGVILGASPASAAAAGPGRPIDRVGAALAESLDLARAAGVLDERVVLDPGIGFFRPLVDRWWEWDAAVIGCLDALAPLGRPICVGLSRKSFIGVLTGRDDPAHRLAGSLAATAIAVYRGAALVRTHDVEETGDAIRVAVAMRS
jgi:dihydropteroate synthase